jgi:hypothetical protein
LTDELEKMSITDNYNISKEEKEWIDSLKILEKKYKEIRNNDYFSHLKSKKDLEIYAKKLLKEKKIKFSEDDFKTIINNVILVKLSDRIQNLEDIEISWSKNPDKIEKKLLETEEYILPLAREVNEVVYQYIKQEIYKIRKSIIKIDTLNYINANII